MPLERIKTQQPFKSPVRLTPHELRLVSRERNFNIPKVVFTGREYDDEQLVYMESLWGLFKSRWNSERIVIPSFKQTNKTPPKITMKINEKRMKFVRKFLGGPFNHEKHLEEMEKKLLYVQEREWKSPIKAVHKIDSNYINILRA